MSDKNAERLAGTWIIAMTATLLIGVSCTNPSAQHPPQDSTTSTQPPVIPCDTIFVPESNQAQIEALQHELQRRDSVIYRREQSLDADREAFEILADQQRLREALKITLINELTDSIQRLTFDVQASREQSTKWEQRTRESAAIIAKKDSILKKCIIKP